MAYNALYNFGNVKIWASDPTLNPNAASILLKRSYGRIFYVPLWNFMYKNINGDKRDSLKGYRVHILIDCRFFTDLDSRALQFLINQINYYTPKDGLRQPIYIAPRYNSTQIYNNIYACVMMNDWLVLDISQHVSVGQSTILNFLSVSLRPNIEYNINFTNQSVVDDDENIWTIDVDGNEVLIQIIGSQLTG